MSWPFAAAAVSYGLYFCTNVRGTFVVVSDTLFSVWYTFIHKHAQKCLEELYPSASPKGPMQKLAKYLNCGNNSTLRSDKLLLFVLAEKAETECSSDEESNPENTELMLDANKPKPRKPALPRRKKRLQPSPVEVQREHIFFDDDSDSMKTSEEDTASASSTQGTSTDTCSIVRRL